jgi:RNA polymerase sigma-70 factor (ECF subfamily)
METVSRLTAYDVNDAASPATRNGSRPSPDRLSTLLLRVAGGDRAALADLYDETSANLFGLLTRMLGRGAAAEEALVEVYSCVWRRAATYRPGENSPLAWLVSTARECVRRKGRHGGAAGSSPETYESPEASVKGVCAAAEPSSTVEAACAGEALRGLDPKQGEALRLCYFSGLGAVETTFNLCTGDARALVRGALERYAENTRGRRVGDDALHNRS